MPDSTDDQPSGPSPEILKHLKDMMPSMIKGIEEGRTTGKGTKVKPPATKRPRKVCTVCCAAFDFVFDSTDDIAIEKALCERCDTKLKEGWIALCAGDKFAFAKSAKLPDMAGQIVQVSGSVMEKLEEVLGIETAQREHDKTKNGDHN